ncbi:hypothetical protein C8Q74DRAFT_401171 [Fomes fomentarius]|nr:hypothetical protein C8Q74DRAFT_401171 [Fomes fomentarius]
MWWMLLRLHLLTPIVWYTVSCFNSAYIVRSSSVLHSAYILHAVAAGALTYLTIRDMDYDALEQESGTKELLSAAFWRVWLLCRWIFNALRLAYRTLPTVITGVRRGNTPLTTRMKTVVTICDAAWVKREPFGATARIARITPTLDIPDPWLNLPQRTYHLRDSPLEYVKVLNTGARTVAWIPAIRWLALAGLHASMASLQWSALLCSWLYLKDPGLVICLKSLVVSRCCATTTSERETFKHYAIQVWKRAVLHGKSTWCCVTSAMVWVQSTRPLQMENREIILRLSSITVRVFTPLNCNPTPFTTNIVRYYRILACPKCRLDTTLRVLSAPRSATKTTLQMLHYAYSLAYSTHIAARGRSVMLCLFSSCDVSVLQYGGRLIEVALSQLCNSFGSLLRAFNRSLSLSLPSVGSQSLVPLSSIFRSKDHAKMQQKQAGLDSTSSNSDSNANSDRRRPRIRKSLSLGALDWVLDDPELRDSFDDDWELRRRMRPLPFDFNFNFDHIDRESSAGETVGNHVGRATTAALTSMLGRATDDVDANQTGDTHGKQEKQHLASAVALVRQGFQQAVQWTEASQFKAGYILWDSLYKAKNQAKNPTLPSCLNDASGSSSASAALRPDAGPSASTILTAAPARPSPLCVSIASATDLRGQVITTTEPQNGASTPEEPKHVKLSRRMRTRLRLAVEAAAAAESDQAGDGLGAGYDILPATGPTGPPASIVDGASTMVGPAGPGTFTRTTGAGVLAGDDISPKKKRVRRGGRGRNNTMELGMAFARAAAAAVRRAIRLGSVAELQLGDEERTGVAKADEERWNAYGIDERKRVEGEGMKGEGASVVAQAEAWAQRLVAVNTCYRILAALKAHVHVAVVPEKVGTCRCTGLCDEHGKRYGGC